MFDELRNLPMPKRGRTARRRPAAKLSAALKHFFQLSFMLFTGRLLDRLLQALVQGPGGQRV